MFEPMLDSVDWRRHRPTVALETNLARKGLVSLGGAGGIDTEDLLGPVKATIPLRVNDLDVLAWLSARRPFGGQNVLFSRSQLAEDLYGRTPGGRERRIVGESLTRLSETRLTFRGYSPLAKQLRPFTDVQLLPNVEREDGKTTRATFAHWLFQHLDAGYVTYLSWSTLRSLTGLAKRLWIYLEAESLTRRRAKKPAWLALGDKTWAALGMDFKRSNQARVALREAASRIEGVDREYLLAITPHGPSGYKLEIHLSPLRPDESRSPALRQGDIMVPVIGDKDSIMRLDQEDLDWIRLEPKALVVAWNGDTAPEYHRADCVLLRDAQEMSKLRDLMGFASLEVFQHWLLEQRVASPRLCPECKPPRPRFPMGEKKRRRMRVLATTYDL